MAEKRRVGITGANGSIGRVLMKGLAAEYDLKAFSRREVEFPTGIVHFDKAGEVKGSFTGLDAVIHLAADPSPAAAWESVVPGCSKVEPAPPPPLPEKNGEGANGVKGLWTQYMGGAANGGGSSGGSAAPADDNSPTSVIVWREHLE